MSNFHLSFSRISSYLNCPRWFKYRYQMNLPEPVTDALLIGMSVHDAIETYFYEIMAGLTPELSLVKSLKQFAGAWIDKPYINKDKWTGEFIFDRPEGEVKEVAHELLTMYLNNNPLKPVVGEQTFTRNFSGVPFTGRLDLIDQRGYIIDFKTASGRLSRNDTRRREFEKTLQPVAYAALLGGPATVEFHYLLKTKSPSLAIESRKITQQQIDWFAKSLVPDIAQAIKTEAFPPAGWPWAGGWPCQWCSFTSLCKKENVIGEVKW